MEIWLAVYVYMEGGVGHFRKRKYQCVKTCSPNIDIRDVLQFYLCHPLILSRFGHSDTGFLLL